MVWIFQITVFFSWGGGGNRDGTTSALFFLSRTCHAVVHCSPPGCQPAAGTCVSPAAGQPVCHRPLTPFPSCARLSLLYFVVHAVLVSGHIPSQKGTFLPVISANTNKPTLGKIQERDPRLRHPPPVPLASAPWYLSSRPLTPVQPSPEPPPKLRETLKADHFS